MDVITCTCPKFHGGSVKAMAWVGNYTHSVVILDVINHPLHKCHADATHRYKWKMVHVVYMIIRESAAMHPWYNSQTVQGAIFDANRPDDGSIIISPVSEGSGDVMVLRRSRPPPAARRPPPAARRPQ